MFILRQKVFIANVFKICWEILLLAGCCPQFLRRKNSYNATLCGHVFPSKVVAFVAMKTKLYLTIIHQGEVFIAILLSEKISPSI